MKNKMLKYIFIFPIIFSLAAFSCSSQGEEETIIPFEVILSGSYASVSVPKQVAVTNNDDYQKLMAEVYANLDQMPKIPDVDFTKYEVAAVFMGTKNTGGYTVNFDKLIKRNDAVTCAVFETSPGKNCINTEVLSQPYEIIKFPKADKKIKFLLKQRIKDCN